MNQTSTVTSAELEIGLVVGLCDEGSVLVTYASSTSAEAATARSTVALSPNDIGCSVALLFERGDVSRPVVIGRMRTESRLKSELTPMTADLDGRLVTITAKERIRLVCGKASLTLEADGTIDITGVHIENRASGQNKIRGASVSLN